MFPGFLRTRRAAVAVIMAVSMAPLMFLVGIAVDYTFLSQDRTQSAFAAQAAATQATRVAAATYSLEVQKGSSSTSAAQTAIADANVAGNLWYSAELGNLTRGTPGSPTTSTTYDGGTTGTVNTSEPPNFQAVVSSSTSYPPIFNALFGQTSPWVYNSGATATTAFSYAQILLMLDTSGSMLIGADSPTDTLPMEQGTVCPPPGSLAPNTLGANVPMPTGDFFLNTTHTGNTHPALNPTQAATLNYLYNTPDGDDADLGATDATPTSHYPGTSDTDVSENCTGTGYGFGTTGHAGTPCALACHYSNTISSTTGQYEDFYGLARSEGVTLRLDVVLSATENVISDMETSQAVANQLSVGVYQFNTDVFPIVNGSTGSGGYLPEATSDLATALTKVEAVDWKKTPTETAIPQFINQNTNYLAPNASTAGLGGTTNFPLSLSDLEAGHASPTSVSGGYQALTVSGNGATASTPLKFIFIVTDGLEDDSGNNGDGNGSNSYNVAGEMTSVVAETAGTGVCSYLKNTLKYTVYVLYVDYNALSDASYYSLPGARTPNSYLLADYPSDTVNNTSIENETAVETTGGPVFDNSPTALALQACASSANDFYEANSSSSIQAALNLMLKAALSSTIRLTN